jgi:tetratricopeptide (TPR) repeat protein
VRKIGRAVDIAEKVLWPQFSGPAQTGSTFGCAKSTEATGWTFFDALPALVPITDGTPLLLGAPIMNQRAATTKSTIILLLAVTAVGGLVGCANKDNKQSGMIGGRDRTDRDGPIDEFGTSKEPPVTAATHVAAGQVSESRGDLPTAIVQYEQAVEKDPKMASAWYLLASARARATRYDASIAAWNSYIRLVGNDASAYANLGFTYDLARRNDDAERTYRRAIEIDPKNKPARTNYGLMLAKANRITEAQQQFAAVMPPAAVLYNIASVFEQQGKTDQAKAEYEAALKLDPKFRAARVRLDALNDEKSAKAE